jgi:hypothetical protein
VSTPTRPSSPPAPAASATETAPEQPDTRARLGWLLRNYKLWIVALVLLLLAAAVAVGSLAVFTSSDANAGNMVATGNLEVTSDDGAILNVTGLVPGESGSGTVAVENSGDVEGVFTLSASNLSDTPASPALSERLDLVIVDAANPGNPVYQGKLAGVVPASPRPLGTWNGGEKHTFEFTVTFPGSGTPAEDNPLKSARSELTFSWDARSK